MGVIPDCVPDYTVLIDQVEQELKTLKISQKLQAPSTRLDWCLGQGKNGDARHDSSSVAAVEAGHKKWHQLQWCLENNGYKRSASQKELHMRYSYATLPKLYGSAVFESHQFEILQYHKLERIRFEVLCMAPRRFGKSWSVAMFIAACLIVIPEIIISEFSPGQRASSALMRLTIKILRRTPGFADKYEMKQSKEQLIIKLRGGSGEDLRYAYFYPNSAKGLRGVNADIIILEEAAHLDLGVFFEVVLPLMGMADTVLIGITTPDGKVNFYSDLVTMVDEHGQLYFEVYHLSLICDACKRNFADSLEKQTECVHNQHLMPPWKELGRAQMLHKLMESRPELYAQEVQGEMVQKTAVVFPYEYLQALKERSRYISKVDFKVRHWFGAIDPTGGGASRFAMSSGFFGPQQDLIVRIIVRVVLLLPVGMFLVVPLPQISRILTCVPQSLAHLCI